MPIPTTFFHLSRRGFSRAGSGGNVSLVSLAAYRSGRQLIDPVLGVKTRDWSEKPEVGFVGVFLPEGVAAEDAEDLSDPEALFGAADMAEDARLDHHYRKSPAKTRAAFKASTIRAVEDEISLPNELTWSQAVDLVADVCSVFAAKGEIALGCLHMKPGNTHGHFLRPAREWDGRDFGRKIPHLHQRGRSRRDVVEVRGQVADLINRHLAEAGYERRVDARSYETMGVRLEPTCHEGRGAHVGGRSMRVWRNAAVASENRERLLEEPWIALDLVAAQRRSFTVGMVRSEIDRRVDLDASERERLTEEAMSRAVRIGRDWSGDERWCREDRAKALSAATKAAAESHAALDPVLVDLVAAESALLEGGLAAGGLESDAAKALLRPSRFAWLASPMDAKGAGKVLAAAAAALSRAGRRVEEVVCGPWRLGLPAFEPGRRPDYLFVADAAAMEPAAFLALVARSSREGFNLRAGIDARRVGLEALGEEWRAVAEGVSTPVLESTDPPARAASALRMKEAVEALEASGRLSWSRGRAELLAMLPMEALKSRMEGRDLPTPVCARQDEAVLLADRIRSFLVGAGEVAPDGLNALLRTGEAPLSRGDRVVLTRPMGNVEAGALAKVLSFDGTTLQAEILTGRTAGTPDGSVSIDIRLFPDVAPAWALPLHLAEKAARLAPGFPLLPVLLADEGLDAQQSRRILSLPGCALAADRTMFPAREDLARSLSRDGDKMAADGLMTEADMKAASLHRRMVGRYLRAVRKAETLGAEFRSLPAKDKAKAQDAKAAELAAATAERSALAKTFLAARALWRPYLSEARTRWAQIELHAGGMGVKTPADFAARDRVLAFEAARIQARLSDRPKAGARDAEAAERLAAERDRLAAGLLRSSSLHAPWAEAFGVEWSAVERFGEGKGRSVKAAVARQAKDPEAFGAVLAFAALRKAAGEALSEAKAKARRAGTRAADAAKGALGLFRRRDLAAVPLAQDLERHRPHLDALSIPKEEVSIRAEAAERRAEVERCLAALDSGDRMDAWRMAEALRAQPKAYARHLDDLGISWADLPGGRAAEGRPGQPDLGRKTAGAASAAEPAETPKTPKTPKTKEGFHAEDVEGQGRGGRRTARQPHARGARGVGSGPPAFLKGRLRRLSECGLAFVRSRTALLLQGVLRDDVGFDGAGGDHRLRRPVSLNGTPKVGVAVEPKASGNSPPMSLSKELEAWMRQDALRASLPDGDSMKDALASDLRTKASAYVRDASLMARLDAGNPMAAESLRAAAPDAGEGVLLPAARR